MGHIVFLFIHLIALLFLPMALFVTIPAHLIYGAAGSRREPRPNNRTHTRCPQCDEIVLRNASICKHCKQPLTPSSPPAIFSKAWFTSEI